MSLSSKPERRGVSVAAFSLQLNLAYRATQKDEGKKDPRYDESRPSFNPWSSTEWLPVYHLQIQSVVMGRIWIVYNLCCTPSFSTIFFPGNHSLQLYQAEQQDNVVVEVVNSFPKKPS